jgi:hypothetical protein
MQKMISSNLVNIYLIMLSFFAFNAASDDAHNIPHTIYVSVTSVYFPNDGTQPELKIRLFFDDLQRCVKEEWALKEIPDLGFFAGENMDRYLNKHLKISLDTTVIAYKMESLEEDGEAISIHMIPSVLVPDSLAKVWKKMTVQTDLFVNQIEQQQNLVRVRYESKREFFNLDQNRLTAVFSR